jgi:hypothetical protein
MSLSFAGTAQIFWLDLPNQELVCDRHRRGLSQVYVVAQEEKAVDDDRSSGTSD